MRVATANRRPWVARLLPIVGVAVAAVAWIVSLTSAEPRSARSMPEDSAGLPVLGGPPWLVAGGDDRWSFSSVAKRVTPAVVNIASVRVVRTRRRFPSIFDADPFFRYFGIRPHAVPRERRERSLGSGVIVTDDGVVLTNNHVIADAAEVKVYGPDGAELSARVLGTDPQTDVAVLQLEGEGFPTVMFADSDSAEVGDVVLAIGNPFGIGQTVTMGIVSAVGKANVGVADYEDFIQTDAAINPGNSGGALVNVEGELIGINTAIFSRSGGYQGIGFAIPSNMARQVMSTILRTGHVQRGWIGVTTQDNTTEIAEGMGLARSDGALVSDVGPTSTGARADLRRGDLIVGFDGQPVADAAEFERRVALAAVGETVGLEVYRGPRRVDVDVEIGERTEQLEFVIDSENWLSPLEGVVVENLGRRDAQRLGLKSEARGVVVVDVLRNSPAALSGLRVDDTILEINRHSVGDVDEFRQMAENLVGSTIIVLVARSGRLFYLRL